MLFEHNRDLVLIIEDDTNFSHACQRELREKIGKLPSASQLSLDFQTITCHQQFEEVIRHLSAWNGLKSVIYALVDVRIPTVEGVRDANRYKEIENGNSIIKKLRDEKVFFSVISSLPREEIDAKVNSKADIHFIHKDEFSEKVSTLAQDIVARALSAPETSAEGKARVEQVLCPNGSRRQSRILPLAYESSRMTDTVNRINRGEYDDAAAVLLIGEEGVEFEQIGWLLYRKLTERAGGGNQELRYEIFNGSSHERVQDLIMGLKNWKEVSEGKEAFYFIENIHALNEQDATRLTDLMEDTPGLCAGNLRVVLTGEKGKVDVRVLDLFALAGNPDFFIIDIYPLRSRQKDIGPYLDYYLGLRNSDEKMLPFTWGPRAKDVLMALRYPRNFKELAVRLDELFRRCGKSVITVRDVREVISSRDLVGTISHSVVQRILRSAEQFERLEHEEKSPHEDINEELNELKKVCAQLVAGRDQELDSSSREDDRMYQDLQAIVAAITDIKGLRNDPSAVIGLEQKENFWPFERYPFSAGLLRELRRHGYSIGIRPRR